MAEPAVALRAPGATVTLQVAEGGMATLEFVSMRGSSVAFGVRLLRDLDARLGELEEAAARGEVALLLVRTTAPHPALSGYDPEELRALSSEGIVGWSREAQSILRRLEQLPFPSVAIVQGDWAGGAAELALACSYRVAAATTEARIAFPQTRRGLLPAWGGTVRLPRLVGLQGALRLALTGDSVPAREAREMGLVDHLIPIDEFDDRLRKYLQKLLSAGQGAPKRRRRVARRLFEDTAPGRRVLAARAARRHLGDPSATLASRLALELMIETCALPLAHAFERESAAAAELIVSSETQGRLHSERVTAPVAWPRAPARDEPGAAAVLGGGDTGSDFVGLLLGGGRPVRIRDARAVARGAVARARARLDWEIRQGRLTETEGAARSALIEGGSGFGGFGLLDVAIVAPDGTSHDVATLAAEVEGHIREDCLLGFHDWSLAAENVQSAAKHPERVVGLMPSLPIDRFSLLEIVPGAATSPESVDAARRLARMAGITAIVVRDRVPTPGVRLLSIYLGEAARILETGVPADRIDAALEDFGFSVGPFHRIDAIGSRRAARLLDGVASAMGERVSVGPVFRMIADHGANFYRYRAGRPHGVNRDLADPASGRGEESPDDALAIRRRILLLLINEAARIVEDGCVMDPADLEAIAILGLGFPREHGGLLYYANSLGLPAVLKDLERAEREIAPCFSPAPLIRELVATGGGFFSEPASGSGHDSAVVLE